MSALITPALTLHSRTGHVYLAALQCLFLLTWIVYVVFLGDFMARMGWSKEWVARLLLLDQVLFVFADVTLGFYADRLMNGFRRVAPFILSLNLLACITFVAIPWLPALGSAVFVGLTVLWVVSASVLRAPLYGLIARQSASASVPMLFGLGVAGALGPYLGVVLKEVDPVLPFAVSGMALALMTLALPLFDLGQVSVASVPKPAVPRMLPVLLGIACVAVGFQLHVFINSAALFKQVADVAWLPWLMPVFWVGFSLAVYPGMRLVDALGSARTLALAGFLGLLSVVAAGMQPALPILVAIQAAAGVAWGMAFVAALAEAGARGHTGREGLFVGQVFAVMAVAAIFRIGLGLQPVAWPLQTTLVLAALAWGIGTFAFLINRRSQ